MCEPNDFYLGVFTFWFDRESIVSKFSLYTVLQ